MKRWPILVATMLGLMTGAVAASAQDLPIPKAKPKAVARPASRATPGKRAVTPAANTKAKLQPQAADDPVATHARAAADIAQKEATCLREAARQVQGAALRLRSARNAADVSTRRDELAFAVGVMDECRNIAQKRSNELGVPEPAPEVAPAPAAAASAPAAAAPAPVAPGPPSFSFGDIRVEAGSIQPAALVRALRSSAPRLSRCYARAEHVTPGLHGNVQLRMRFAGADTNSRPSAVIIPDSTLSSDAVHRCLAQAMMHTSFGRTDPGSQIAVTLGFAR